MTSLQAVLLLGAGFLVVWGLMDLFEGNKGTARANAALTLRGEFKRPQGGGGGGAVRPPGGRGNDIRILPAGRPLPVAEPEVVTPNQDLPPQPQAEDEGRGYLAIIGDVVTVGQGTVVGVASTAGAIAAACTVSLAPAAVGLSILAASNFDDVIAATRRLLGNPDAESLKFNVTKELTGSETKARVTDIGVGILLGGKLGGAARAADDVARVTNLGVGLLGVKPGGAGRAGRAGRAIENAAPVRVTNAARLIDVPDALAEFQKQYNKLGGRYEDMKKLVDDFVLANPKYIDKLEVHHIPPTSVTGIPKSDGPAMVMFKPHHRSLPTSRSYQDAIDEIREAYETSEARGFALARREIRDLVGELAHQTKTDPGPLADVYERGFREGMEYMKKGGK
ncbi:MAG: hypothetical protein ACKODX_15545 [Gemmata sp.]